MNHIQPTRMDLLVNGQLPEPELQQLESHLDQCETCRKQLENHVAAPVEWEQAGNLLVDSHELAPSNWMTSNQAISVELSRVEQQVRSIGALPAEIQLDPATHPENLGRIDGFEIEKEIGRGGCGVVYKGFDRVLNRPVAIKVLAPHLASSGIARKRFAREARAAAAVVHPNVVPIHSVSSGPERPYMVMRLVNGRSLEAHIREHGPLELIDVVRISQQIAAGLAAAHRQGLIHRDIKPANILLEQDVSRVMITDFGLARAADDAALTQTGWLAGTPFYMSPEQASGTVIDQRSDLFSLGSLIYFMATGREPFRAEKPFAVIQKIINETPQRARSINPDISKTMGQILDRLLAKNPKNRFRSAEEVQETLERYLAHLQNPLASPKPKLARPRRKLAWSCAIVVLLATVTFTAQRFMRLTLPAPESVVAPAVDSELPAGPSTTIAGTSEESATNPADAVAGDATNEPNPFWNDETLEQELKTLDAELRKLETEFSIER